MLTLRKCASLIMAIIIAVNALGMTAFAADTISDEGHHMVEYIAHFEIDM